MFIFLLALLGILKVVAKTSSKKTKKKQNGQKDNLAVKI